MGTRSTIALEYADGTVDQIYCHWDGYLEHNGAILLEHYMDPFKVQQMMALGDMSSLGPNIGEKHDFDCPADIKYGTPEYEAWSEAKQQICTFYGRDRGETGTKAKNFVEYYDYRRNHQYEEFEYILRQVEGKATWFVADHSDNYVELSVAMELVKETA